MNNSVVIDTNVIVSAMYSPKGKPAEVLDLFFTGKIELFFSNDILAEYEDVLSRPTLKLSVEKKLMFLNILRQTGSLVEPVASSTPLPDNDDRVFYDVAKSVGATLITGNIKHFPNDLFIMTPADFLKERSLGNPTRRVIEG